MDTPVIETPGLPRTGQAGPVFPGPPPGADAALGMARLAEGDAEQARRILSRAVADGDLAPATVLSLAIAADRTGLGDAARQAFQMLQERFPDWDEPVLRRAESLRAASLPDAAEAAYHMALTLNPQRHDAMMGLATLLLTRGEAHRAHPLLERFVAEIEDDPDAWALLGSTRLALDDAPGAEIAFAQACRLAPATLDHALRRASAAYAAGGAEAELDRLDQMLARDPLDVVSMTVRAVLLERLGRLAEAIDLLQAASALAPDTHIILATLGSYLGHADRLGESEAVLRRAIELQPDELSVRVSLGGILVGQQRHAEAIAELEPVIAQDGTQVIGLLNLAMARVQTGQQAAGMEAARAAVALAPELTRAHRTYAHSLAYCDGVSGAELLAALRAHSDTLPRPPVRPFANPRDPDRALRVGILSGTFYAHPVGWLTIAGFEWLDPAQFELIGLSARPGKQDAMAARFRQAAREWHDVQALDDEALAARIRALGIDILIEQGGLGEASRLAVCARRPAPVQIKWVGCQFHSSGLPEMDWIIADRWEIPSDLERFYIERPLRLADGYICFSPPAYAPDIRTLPALANGCVTFGVFNNLAKVTPPAIRVWAEILQRVPHARIILKSRQFADRSICSRIEAQLVAHGIAAGRVMFRTASDHRAFMDECNDIDIMLDPFPYAGGLTTCEALWMGVPTVTLAGESFAARHSASHLSNAGLPDWVTQDTTDYVNLAVARAADPAALIALRAGLRAQVKASPLCDAPRFGRSLGAGLRHAWHAWCAGG